MCCSVSTFSSCFCPVWFLPSFCLLQLLQSALSVHPDKVEKTIDDIMALKKINPDTNPQ